MFYRCSIDVFYEENGFPSGLRQPGPLGRLEGGMRMNNIIPVDTCPVCKAGTDKCKVVNGKGYLITLRCTKCGCRWNTLNIFALPKGVAK